jgi:hypothetical protein
LIPPDVDSVNVLPWHIGLDAGLFVEIFAFGIGEQLPTSTNDEPIYG